MNIRRLTSAFVYFYYTALFPLNAMATKLTIEQRLELLENECRKINKIESNTE